jgi:purine-nucleoside phosphorylase
MLEKIAKTADFIRSKTKLRPKIAIVLGTGLGGLVNDIEIVDSISYSDIPNFPVSTVKGHQGRLIFGRLGGKDIVAMQGRFHFYEGYSMLEVTFPFRVFKNLGIEILLLSNAAGGMNKNFKVGDIMFINDHINLIGTNPLIGKNYDELGPRFPDFSEPYDHELLKIALNAANSLNIPVHQGVYAAMSGPTFETPAEYRYLRIIGADAVGMSTVPEAIVARHSSIRVFAVSIITDLGGMDEVVPVSHEEVIEAANKAEPKMTAIIKKILSEIK